MSKLGIRVGQNAKAAKIKDLKSTSEANQWKVHSSGVLIATSNNQVFTIIHGLKYTPAYLAYYKAVANSYFEWGSIGGKTYIDPTLLSLQATSIGDKIYYIIFKDFGA